jgi:hypothetical protein
MESADDRRKRLKALVQPARDGDQPLDATPHVAGSLVNPFADEGKASTTSGPCSFYR